MATRDIVIARRTPAASSSRRKMGLRLTRLTGVIVALAILTAGSLLLLMPLVWMLTTSLKTDTSATVFPPQWIPTDPRQAVIDGKKYYLYNIPVEGQMRQLALLRKESGKGIFVDPADPGVTYALDTNSGKRIQDVVLHWENYPAAFTKVPFMKYLSNTMIIVVTTTIGVLISCILVAYGFSRFRARWLDVFFLILLSTIMLPPQVTLIPQFVLFQKLGWYDTYLPLIVPAFFANAWDVFLLRQFFMSIPLELDEAATIDGAGPLGVLLYIIIPQAWPAVATVAIFHFLYAWNDFYAPLIYIQSKDKWTVALGLQSFNAMYTRNYSSMMAAATVTMLPCLLLFFFAQKLFIQGIFVSGIKG